MNLVSSQILKDVLCIALKKTPTKFAMNQKVCAFQKKTLKNHKRDDVLSVETKLWFLSIHCPQHRHFC